MLVVCFTSRPAMRSASCRCAGDTLAMKASRRMRVTPVYDAMYASRSSDEADDPAGCDEAILATMSALLCRRAVCCGAHRHTSGTPREAPPREGAACV